MGESVHQPFKSQVSVSFRPSGMLDVSPLVFKADFLGALLSGAGPTLGVFDESPETLAPQIYAPFLWNRSCLWVAAQRVGFWQGLCLCDFYPSACGLFTPFLEELFT